MTGAAQEEAARMQAARAGDRKLVRTAQLVLTVDDETDFPDTLERAEALTEDAEGYVAEARTGGLVLRLPNERLEPVLDALAALGEVDQRNVRAADVTAQYTDLDVQIENTRAFRSRLRELLAEAEDVSTALEVERELARATTQLERLEGQTRLLQNQVVYARIALSLKEKVKPGPLGYVFYELYRSIKWLFVRN